MPAAGRGAFLTPRAKAPAPKAAPKAPPVRTGTPAPRANPFSGNLQKTFAPLGKKVGAPSRLGSPRVQREAAEHEVIPEKILGLIPAPWGGTTRAQEQKSKQLAKEAKVGVVVPGGVPGIRFAAGAGVAGKVLENAKASEHGLGKFWNSFTRTLANIPAGTLETAKDPLGTLKGLERLYGDPEKAWNENEAGTVLAFLPIAAGLDRAAGGLVRRASGGRLMPLGRSDLHYTGGTPQARHFQPGLVAGAAERVPGAVAKALGKGETPIQRGAPATLPEPSRGTWRSPTEVPLNELKRGPGGKRILKPNSKVTIYRVQTGKGIKPGKGVLLEKPTHAFAPHLHLETAEVPASHVFGERNQAPNQFGVQEYGYHPPDHSVRPVSGEEFLKAVEKARAESPRHAVNLTPHPASHYTKAFLSADGKAGVALVKTGKRLKDGRPEVEMVNLFNHGSTPGIGKTLSKVAAYEGANKLDALEGHLTQRHASEGWRMTHREPWDRKAYGEPPAGVTHIQHMELPQVSRATKGQERVAILGSRLGGLVRPGQVDLIRGGERLARNLEVMKRNHFLDQHLPHDEAHATAMMQFLQGEAKRPETFWHDVAERRAELVERAHELTGKELAYNKAQVARLDHLIENKNKVSPEDLAHYAKSAGEVAHHQRVDWELLNQEGVGHPGQLNARNLTALLLHGHHLGRGKLTFDANPGPHELVGLAKQADSAANKFEREIKAQRAEIKGLRLHKDIKAGQHFRLEHLIEQKGKAVALANDYRNKLAVMTHTGQLKPNGDQFPGVFDAAGKRVTEADAQKLLNQEFEGREMGFLTHKQEKVQAQSQNTYGPRSLYPMRTGGNFLAGAYDNSPAALRDHFDRVAKNLATMRGRRSVGENLVLVKNDGKPFENAHEAEKAADNANMMPGGEPITHHLGKWVAYNMGAAKVADVIKGNPYGEMLEHQGIVEHHAINEESGAWGIIPEKVAERLQKWDKVEGQVADSFLRKMTTPWRQTNLYTSVRWPWGTTQENAIRLAAHKVSPLVVLPGGKHTSFSFGTGSQVVKFLDDKIHDPAVPPAQKQMAIFHRTMYGTGNFVGSQLHELEPALHKLAEDSKWRKITESAPNTKIWRPYRRFVGNSLAKMETNAKVAAGGKLATGDLAFFKRFRRVDREQAAANYVEKITSDPAESIKAAQNLMEIMGNWNHLTPHTRTAQAEWAPFALWWLNSAKFVFKTLPKDHPYATGLLAAMVMANGLQNRDLKDYLTGTVPLDLPFTGKINLNPVHYSPFDIANEPLDKAASMVAPQITEPSMEAKGIDPLTGDKYVTGEGNEGVSLGHLIASGLGSYVPGVRIGSQLARRGGRVPKKSFLPWEIEPGTSKGLGKAAAKTFAPFMFTYQNPEEQAAGKPEPPISTKPSRVRVQRDKITRERAHR